MIVAQSTLPAVVGTALGISLLNPGVYVDAVLMIGGVSSSYPPDARGAFLAGAMAMSCIWFAALASGAWLLAPMLADRTTRSWIDGYSGAILLGLATRLLVFG